MRLLVMEECTQPSGAHGDCSPDSCFAAKLRYMRDGGGLNVAYPWGGRQNFKGPTNREKARATVEGAKANGLEPVSVASRWV